MRMLLLGPRFFYFGFEWLIWGLKDLIWRPEEITHGVEKLICTNLRIKHANESLHFLKYYVPFMASAPSPPPKKTCSLQWGNLSTLLFCFSSLDLGLYELDKGLRGLNINGQDLVNWSQDLGSGGWNLGGQKIKFWSLFGWVTCE